MQTGQGGGWGEGDVQRHGGADGPGHSLSINFLVGNREKDQNKGSLKEEDKWRKSYEIS